MNYFVFGYTDKKCSQGHTLLYAGTSRSEANAALTAGREGLATGQIFCSPQPHKTDRYWQKVGRTATIPQQAEPQPPAEPEGEVGTPDPAPADDTPPPSEEPSAEAEPQPAAAPLPLPAKKSSKS